MTTRRALGATLTAAIAAGLGLSAPPAAAQPTEPWEFRASLNGWFPDISGRTQFPSGAGGPSFDVDIGTILDNLEFTFQATFDARRGRYGLLADVVYMGVGASRSQQRDFSLGGVQVPAGVAADTNLDLDSWIWTFAGYYRALDEPNHTLDILGGLRLLDMDQTLDWTLTGNVGAIPLPGRTGRATASTSNWDAIIGIRGRVSFGPGNPWYVPYYLDIGAGESDFTWQAMVGVGYAFRWGELAVAWRYLAYELSSDSRIADLTISGPLVSASFRW
jgi:hypothetical protein